MTGGCTGGTNTATGSIVVNGNNSIALTSGAGTDTQVLCLNTPIVPISYSTTGATGATVSGLPTGVSGTWANNTLNINGTPLLAGVYNYSVTMTGGCLGGTSSVGGRIIVNSPSAFNLLDTICEGTYYLFGGDTLRLQGVYNDTLAAGNGCDSIVVLNLYLIEKPVEPYLVRIPGTDSLIASPSDRLIWLRNGSVIQGGPNGTLLATQNGLYQAIRDTVVGTIQCFSDTSNAINLLNVGVFEIDEHSRFICSPNPFTSQLNVQSSILYSFESARYTLFSVDGKPIKVLEPVTFSINSVTFDLSYLDQGTYYLLVGHKEFKQTIRIVKIN
jgi:hypothetical protein